MLEAQKLEKSLWTEAVANAVYTLNQCLMRTLPSVTLEETWRGRSPCVAYMRMFGSLAYTMVLDEKRGKLNAEEIKGV